MYTVPCTLAGILSIFHDSKIQKRQGEIDIFMTEYSPMLITKVDPDFAFMMFALTESGNAIRSIGELEQLFNVRDRVNDAVERRENASIFAKLRLVLTYSASVSRIFWPAKDSSKIKRRCKRLRDLVGITDGHALSNRDLRNHIEHFDERLDSWVGGTPSGLTGTKESERGFPGIW